MYNTNQTPANNTVTVTLTQEQYDIFVNAMNEAKARDERIAVFTGETAADIEARYSVPHDSIIDDMIDAYTAQTTGIPMF